MKAHICVPFNSQVNRRIYDLKDNECDKLLKSNNIAALHNVKRNVNIQKKVSERSQTCERLCKNICKHIRMKD
jgi:hypothetical protein